MNDSPRPATNLSLLQAGHTFRSAEAVCVFVKSKYVGLDIMVTNYYFGFIVARNLVSC